MLNYMKSESYRLIKGKGLYMTTALLAGLVLFMNVVLSIADSYIPDFPYGTFRFSLNVYTSAMFGMVLLGACIAGILFWDDRRNGVLRNAVSYGVPREKLFVGKCIVAIFFTFLILCVVMAVYVGSAYLLLDEPEWLPLREMLVGTAATLPSAAAALIFSIFLGAVFQKELIAVVVWAVIYYALPMICFFIGLKVDLFSRLYKWTPHGFLQMEAIVTFSDYQCLWDNAAGLSKCLISGIIGIVIFLGIGIWGFRKQEF